MKEFLVKTPNDFQSVIATVLERATTCVDHAAVVTLTGDLGAGKTTFTQQLARHLGVTESVVSPTFGIMKEYELVDHPRFDQLIHIDAYRIEDIAEVGPLRFQELFLHSRTLVCLEWPEKIANILPKDVISVSIKITQGEERGVVVI